MNKCLVRYRVGKKEKLPEFLDLYGLNRDIAKLRGGISGLWGTLCGKLKGNSLGIYGDVTGVRGNLDFCKITMADRLAGIDIEQLIFRTKYKKSPEGIRVCSRCLNSEADKDMAYCAGCRDKLKEDMKASGYLTKVSPWPYEAGFRRDEEAREDQRETRLGVSAGQFFMAGIEKE